MTSTLTEAEARREQMIREIEDLCEELNRAGAVPRWNLESLDSYINDKFQVYGGRDALAFESGPALIADLRQQLAELAEKKSSAGECAARAEGVTAALAS
jgi:hypothetical protein